MLLGIDQGTTGTRACLVDEGRIIAHAYAAHAQHQPRPGWVEHDPDEIWACTTRVIAEVLARGPRPVGVALANQGETVMIWDARTRRPLHRALVWQDTRTAAMVAELAGANPDSAARVHALTGLRLDPYFSAPKLRWLLDEVPGGRALAAAGHLRAGTLDSWLIDRLTAGAVFATDASTAARTLLCDITTATWSPYLCALFGIPPELLPEIRDSDGGFGVCAGHGLDGVPIVASLVDQPGALLGQGCVDPGDAKATFGTGCFVYVNAGHAPPSSTGTLATIAWRRSGATTYALDGGVLAVGSALGWLDGIGLAGAADLATSLAGRRDEPQGVVCVPALVGLGAPHWDRAARGAWLGMSQATSREDLVAAFVEGLACRVVEVVRATERDAGIAIAELCVDGGLTHAPAIMQLQADLLGCPVVVAEEPEATVLGACALAALRLGTVSLDDLRARRARRRGRYEPTLSADAREAIVVRFQRAIALVRQWALP